MAEASPTTVNLPVVVSRRIVEAPPSPRITPSLLPDVCACTTPLISMLPVVVVTTVLAPDTFTPALETAVLDAVLPAMVNAPPAVVNTTFFRLTPSNTPPVSEATPTAKPAPATLAAPRLISPPLERMLALSRMTAPPIAPAAANGFSVTSSFDAPAPVTPSMPKFLILIERSELKVRVRVVASATPMLKLSCTRSV